MEMCLSMNASCSMPWVFNCARGYIEHVLFKPEPHILFILGKFKVYIHEGVFYQIMTEQKYVQTITYEIKFFTKWYINHLNKRVYL